MQRPKGKRTVRREVQGKGTKNERTERKVEGKRKLQSSCNFVERKIIVKNVISAEKKKGKWKRQGIVL